MSLVLQDPLNQNGSFFLESLLGACGKSTGGFGAFSFATSAGAKLLLADDEFVAFAANHPFDLVIGVDAITDTAAIRTIQQIGNVAARMNVLVFIHEQKNLLFHPKYCWFRTNSGGKLFVGSSNLTVGGLRGNWEAYCEFALDKKDATDVDLVWNTWKGANAANLVALTDPRVLQSASQNNEWVRLVRREKLNRTSRKPTDATSSTDDIGRIRQDSEVLIAEIPKSGDRWNQANFDLANYESFFGAKQGTQRRILLQHVDTKGELGELESRPSVAVKSQNYRFELDAGSGVNYPKVGRPIGVFVRVATRAFLYSLLMPTERHYKKVLEYLLARWQGPATQVRRVRTRVADLRRHWPESRLWEYI